MNIKEYLAAQPFCEGMDEAQRERLAACARLVDYAEGDYLIRQNEPAGSFQLIIEGQVEIKMADVASGTAPLETLNAGEAVGWSWFVPPHRWQFDGVARTPVKVLYFDANCLQQAMEVDKAVGYAVLKALVNVLASRLQAARMQVANIYGPPSEIVL